MKIVSYFTQNSPYEQIAKEKLIPSLIKFNLDYEVDSVKSFGNWQKNTAYKGRFIKEKLQKYNQVVWIDVDATIVKFPQLFFDIPLDCDLAYHKLEWRTWYGYSKSDIQELLTGTMWFNNTEKTIKLCDMWYNSSINTAEWEQKVLQRLITTDTYKSYILPLEYIYIETRPNGKPPLVQIDPVIIHHQASREHKGRKRWE